MRELPLPRTLNLASVAELWPQIKEGIEQRQSLVLLGADVEEAGLAGAQLVLAASAAAREAGLALELASPSRALSQALSLCGWREEGNEKNDSYRR